LHTSALALAHAARRTAPPTRHVSTPSASDAAEKPPPCTVSGVPPSEGAADGDTWLTAAAAILGNGTRSAINGHADPADTGTQNRNQLGIKMRPVADAAHDEPKSPAPPGTGSGPGRPIEPTGDREQRREDSKTVEGEEDTGGDDMEREERAEMKAHEVRAMLDASENRMLSRLLAADPQLWPVIEQRMNQLMPLAMQIITEIFSAYDDMPFGLRFEEFSTIAMTNFGRRLQRIEKARDQLVDADIDEDEV
jgi:hypothetical protein